MLVFYTACCVFARQMVASGLVSGAVADSLCQEITNYVQLKAACHPSAVPWTALLHGSQWIRDTILHLLHSTNITFSYVRQVSYNFSKCLIFHSCCIIVLCIIHCILVSYLPYPNLYLYLPYPLCIINCHIYYLSSIVSLSSVSISSLVSMSSIFTITSLYLYPSYALVSLSPVSSMSSTVSLPSVSSLV